MKNVFSSLAVLVLLALFGLTGCGGGANGSIPSEPNDPQRLIGYSIIANDSQFLGVISSNTYEADSIMNRNGNYGSPCSATSILNKSGIYGSPDSALSPYNPTTNTPPQIIRNGVAVAYLTTNTALTPRVDPDTLISALSR